MDWMLSSNESQRRDRSICKKLNFKLSARRTNCKYTSGNWKNNQNSMERTMYNRNIRSQ